MVIIGTILLIGVSLLDVTIKQVRLTTNAKQSELAFQAANAGMECARSVRNLQSDQMEAGSSITPSCFNPSSTLFSNEDGTVAHSGSGDVYRYEYEFTWGSGIDTKCTEITMLAAVSDINNGVSVARPTVQTYIPGYPDLEGNFDCEAGSRCTLVSSRGFNTACSNKGGFGVVQREVLLEF